MYIFCFYGNFGVSKFILRLYRSCGRNYIVRLVVVPLRNSMKQASKTTLEIQERIQESLSPKVVTNIAKRYIRIQQEYYIFKEKHTNAQLTTHVRTSVVGIPASTSTKRQLKTEQVQHGLHSEYIQHSQLKTAQHKKTQFRLSLSANCSVEL